jgi:hypothetical protein
MPTRVDRARRCGWLAVLLVLAAAGTAHAAATLTYPPNGATVTLDKNANFGFSWNLPPGEIMPGPYVGDTPSYDPDTFSPFASGCGVLPDTATSCRTDSPMSAGTHYVFMFSTDTDNTQHFFSPVTSFVVPPKLGLGCGPVSGGCPEPKGFKTYYIPHPPIGLPNSSLEMAAWFNATDGSPATFSFTIKHGRKVVGRVRDVQHSSDIAVSSGFELTHAQIRWGRHRKHWHAPSGGTRLTCICTVSAEGLTLTRNVTVRTPPR